MLICLIAFVEQRTEAKPKICTETQAHVWRRFERILRVCSRALFVFIIVPRRKSVRVCVYAVFWAGILHANGNRIMRSRGFTRVIAGVRHNDFITMLRYKCGVSAFISVSVSWESLHCCVCAIMMRCSDDADDNVMRSSVVLRRLSLSIPTTFHIENFARNSFYSCLPYVV